MAEPTRPDDGFTEMTLEEALSSRVEVALSGHPVHNIDVFIREVTTTVVRDIVGVIEALLDRLLVKKKSGVVMDMVVAIIEEDLDKLMSKGADSLAAKRWDHVQTELRRLEGLIGSSAKTAESSLAKTVQNFDAKLQATQSKFQELTDRIEVVHKQSMLVTDAEQRFTSVAKAVKVISDHLSATKAEVSSTRVEVQNVQGAIQELDQRCSATFSPKDDVSALESRAAAALKKHATKADKDIEVVSKACSKVKDDTLAEISRHDNVLEQIQRDAKTAQALHAELEKLHNQHKEAVAKEFPVVNEAIKSTEIRLTNEYNRQWQDVQEALKYLALKSDVQKNHSACLQQLSSLTPKVEANSAALETNQTKISKTQSDHCELQAQVNEKLAAMEREMKALEERQASDIGALNSSLEASVDVVREQVVGTVKDVHRSVEAMSSLKQQSMELFATAKSEAWEVRNRIVEEMQWQGEKIKKEVLDQLREQLVWTNQLWQSHGPTVPSGEPRSGPPRPGSRGILPAVGMSSASPGDPRSQSREDMANERSFHYREELNARSPQSGQNDAYWSRETDSIVPYWKDPSKPSGWRLRMEVGKVKLDQHSPSPVGTPSSLMHH